MATAAERSLIEKDIAHLVHPLHNPTAHETAKVWVGGKGSFIVDTEGNEYIDCLSGLWNNTAGNGRPELADAAAAQMRQMGFVSGYAGSSNPRAIELSEHLAHLT